MTVTNEMLNLLGESNKLDASLNDPKVLAAALKAYAAQVEKVAKQEIDLYDAAKRVVEDVMVDLRKQMNALKVKTNAIRTSHDKLESHIAALNMIENPVSDVVDGKTLDAFGQYDFTWDYSDLEKGVGKAITAIEEEREVMYDAKKSAEKWGDIASDLERLK